MAYTVISGLFVATLLTLLFLPALYVAWFRTKEPEPRLQAGGPRRRRIEHNAAPRAAANIAARQQRPHAQQRLLLSR